MVSTLGIPENVEVWYLRPSNKGHRSYMQESLQFTPAGPAQSEMHQSAARVHSV